MTMTSGKKAKVGIAGRYVEIAPGAFEMGSSPDEAGRFGDEKPHPVKLTHRIAMQAGRVTQRQFKLLLGRNPSKFKERGDSDGDFMRVNGEAMNGDHPVEQVSWYDAVEYCNVLSAVKGLKPAYAITNIKRNSDGSIAGADVTLSDPDLYKLEGFRLPTEAEWERAARAGTRGPHWFDAKEIDRHAWHSGNSDGRTHASGDSSHASPWGLHDMLGNAYEWTQDWYAGYPNANGVRGEKVIENPTGPSTGDYRVFRGGAWSADAHFLRSGRRHSFGPADRWGVVSFRPVRSILEP
jgi:formylglycine-generating enzyme required for sulfatase activity